MAKLLLLLFGVLTLSVSCRKSEEPRVELLSPSTIASPSPLGSVTPDVPPQAQQIEKTWSSNFEFASRSIERSHNGIRSYEISVEYPQIIERTPQTVRFNRWIRNKVRGYVKEFESLEQNAEKHDRRKKLRPAHITEALKIWFRVYYLDEHLVSLRLTHSVMALGQMHPINYYETINYDFRSARPLNESDIFKKSYLRVFSAYSRTFVRENYRRDYTEDMTLSEGTEPKRRNFSNWNIVPDGILIAFEDYQIGPHSFGQLELIIPYSELRAVLKPNAATETFVTF